MILSLQACRKCEARLLTTSCIIILTVVKSSFLSVPLEACLLLQDRFSFPGVQLAGECRNSIDIIGLFRHVHGFVRVCSMIVEHTGYSITILAVFAEPVLVAANSIAQAIAANCIGFPGSVGIFQQRYKTLALEMGWFGESGQVT